MSDNLKATTDLSDEEALKQFLLDIDCLNALNPWRNTFNLFDVLKISKTEIRHSNMLAWLLDPNENHGLQDNVIKGFIEQLVKKLNNDTVNIFDLLLMNFYSFKVYREWKSIDILLVSEECKIVICVENKVYSGEHDNQLNRYRDVVKAHYTANSEGELYTHYFVYLTPNGDDASDSENWNNLTYFDLIQIIEASVGKSYLLPDSELLIKNYIETVRWHIVGDENLIRICNDIYKKHKKALDLIYENKADSTQEITNFMAEYMKQSALAGEMFSVNWNKCSKSYLRFTSTSMSRLLVDRDAETSGWKTRNHYFYEITNTRGVIRLQLSLSKGTLSSEERDNYFKRVLTAAVAHDKKLAWTWNEWKIIKSWVLLRYNDNDTIDDIEAALSKKLDKTLASLLEYEEEICDNVAKQGLVPIIK